MKRSLSRTPSPSHDEHVTELSPANPLPGDVVQITAIDNQTKQPIEGLSAVLIRNNITLYGLITDDDGRISFGSQRVKF